MLPEEGLISILMGLENNTFLFSLNLKGNNIRHSGVQEIGKLLRHNNYLQNLYLEWNGVGIFPEKFAVLCEGLNMNMSLKTIDLKNNQLNHVCAQSVADVIIKNSTLQKIDLRWNNIGLIGGRAILNALSKNKTVLALDVSGNDIPSDVMKSIEMAVSISAERYIINNEKIERTKTLASKLQELEKEKDGQLKLLMEQLERKDQDVALNQRLNLIKLNQFQEALVQKEVELQNEVVKSQELQRKLSIKIDEVNSLALALNELEMKSKEMKAEHSILINKERKNKEEMERKLLEENGSLKEENLFLKQKIQDLKNNENHLEEQIVRLKATVSKLESVLKINESSFQEQLSSANERHAEILKEREFLRKKEMTRMREEFLEIENTLKQKLVLLDLKKAELEKELADKKSQLILEKAQADEKLNELEKKMKSDQENLKMQMDKRINLLENVKQKQERLLQEHLQTMYELKKRTTTLDMELAEESHKVQHLQQCLEAKDAEMEVAIAKVRLEVKEQIEDLNRIKLLLQESYDEKELLKKQIENNETKHEEQLKSQNEIIQKLKAEVKQYHNKIYEILETESKRAEELKATLTSYLNSDVEKNFSLPNN
ncbi:leucine-rich repeat-containing protein 45-like isoform X2 [Stegodyphus dumicola]|nr:leucine-rich repeat-containing protein 45-like isoform X2 [Stegodyphus dumicola]